VEVEIEFMGRVGLTVQAKAMGAAERSTSAHNPWEYLRSAALLDTPALPHADEGLGNGAQSQFSESGHDKKKRCRQGSAGWPWADNPRANRATPTTREDESVMLR